MSEIPGEGAVACALSLVDKMFVDTEHLSSGVSFSQETTNLWRMFVYFSLVVLFVNKSETV